MAAVEMAFGWAMQKNAIIAKDQESVSIVMEQEF